MHDRDLHVRSAGICAPCGRFPMPLPKPKLAERPTTLVEATAKAAEPESEFSGEEFSGQRKLIRPNLAMRAAAGRPTALYGHGHSNGAKLTSRNMAGSSPQEDSSHAEVFYFQKQIQAQTRMVVVLENGDELEGVIEWYDRYAIKLRSLGHSSSKGGVRSQTAGHDVGQQNGGGQNGGRTRVLIYKDSIRYIYKAEENAPQIML